MTTTAAPRRLTLERTYDAHVDDVWALWTTKEGLESWWGPEGFTTEVRAIDLRPGGELRYAMTATAPEQVAFMRRAGLPVTTEARHTYTVVDAPRRLAYRAAVDFVPGVAPYEAATTVEFAVVDGRVHMRLTLDPMHDDDWTERARLGHESQLGKLERVLASRR